MSNIERENQESLHFLLWPVRRVQGFLRFLALLILGFFVWVWNVGVFPAIVNHGWWLEVGPNSALHQQKLIDEYEANHEITEFHGIETTKDFAWTPTINTQLPATYGLRAETLFLRKSGRMEDDRYVAYIEVQEMRSVIAALKQGLDPRREFSIHKVNGLWEGDFENLSQAVEDAMNKSPATVASPKVDFHVDEPIVPPASCDGGDSTCRSYDERMADPKKVILGMWLASDPEGESTDAYYYLDTRKDLTSEEPLLSPGQLAAEKALLATMTKEYWLREAHRNGVYRDAELLFAWQAAQYSFDGCIYQMTWRVS